MDANLAKFLFGNEVLYRDTALKPTTISQPKPEQKQEVVAKVEASEMPKAVVPQTNPSNTPVFEPKQKILILTQTISEEEKALLGKIIGAVGLNFENVDIIELSKIQLPDYQSIVTKEVVGKLISFGIGFSKLGWSIMVVPYQNKTTDGIEFLLADNLKNISSNQALKKSLWASLQKMFAMAS